MKDILNKMKSVIKGASDTIVESGYRELIDMTDDLVKQLSQKNPKNLIRLITLSGISPNPTVSAATACKAICLFIECKIKRVYNGDFSGFISTLYNLSGINPLSLRLFDTQENLIDRLAGNTYDVTEIRDYNKYVQYFSENNVIGTVRIKTGEDSYHSIITYRDLDKKRVAISDTGRGGIRVKHTKRVTANNFEYVTYIEERA